MQQRGPMDGLLSAEWPRNTLPSLIFVLLHITWVGTEPPSQGIKEYCQWEVFNASCRADEVVVIQTARYGRMRVARCVKQDFGYVGCSTSILEHMDNLCSGRRRCEFSVPDATMRELHPCPTDLAFNVEASYRCLKVKLGKKNVCSPGTAQVLNVTGGSGYLASSVTARTGHGSEACPWIIRVNSGQRINITLLDFSRSNLIPKKTQNMNEVQKNSGHKMTICQKYAMIRERSLSREVAVCGGYHRESNVYISAGNTVEVDITRYTNPKDIAFFLLRYQAIGCPKVRPPREGWVKFEGQHLTFGCNLTGETWSLRCNGNAWSGEIRECSRYPEGEVPDLSEDYNMWGVLADDWSSPFGILIVTALGVALGLVVGVILLTSVLFCLRRQCCCLQTRHVVQP